jgi:putative ABC transport system ATP-binding protein
VRVQRRFERAGVRALEDVSLAVMPGEWLAVAGPSGSGKSTLLHLMCGLDRPTNGRVLFAGEEPLTLAKWTTLRARRIGFVFQSFHLLPALSARENVEVPMFGLVTSAGQRCRRAQELLAQVGLADRARHRPAELSGGERQRVAIARGLANSPDLLLADEPTGNLDAVASAEIMDLLGTLRRDRNLTLVVVTHSRAVAEHAERRVQLVKGRLVVGEEAA